MWAHWRLDLELGADRAHGGVEPEDRAAMRSSKHEAGRGGAAEQSLRRLRYPDAVRLAVLGAEPTVSRPARHLPPTVDDVLAPHMRDLAGALPGQQNHFQCRTGYRIEITKRLPKFRHFGFRQHALAAAGRVLR